MREVKTLISVKELAERWGTTKDAIFGKIRSGVLEKPFKMNEHSTKANAKSYWHMRYIIDIEEKGLY